MILTENQYRKLLEALNLKSPFANLSVGKIIIVTAKSAKTGEPFDFKFKVVEDLGDSWKLESLTQDSTFTGFEWIIKKNEDVSDSDIKSKNINKKSKKETNYTLKRVTAMDLDDASADDDEDEAPVDGEDVEHPEESEIEKLKALMKEEEGFFFETDNVDKIFFNVIEKTDAYAVIQLMKTEDSDYKDDINKRFKLMFNDKTIEESDEGDKFINLTNVEDNSEDRLVNVTDYNVTEWVEGETMTYNKLIDDLKSLMSNKYFEFQLSDGNTLTFKLNGKRNDRFAIKLLNSNYDDLKKYKDVIFSIDLSEPEKVIKKDENSELFDLILNLSKTGKSKDASSIGSLTLEKIKSYSVVDEALASEFEDAVKPRNPQELLAWINRNPEFKKRFVDRGKLFGFIEADDYTGLSKKIPSIVNILDKKGYDVNIKDNKQIYESFNQGWKVKFKLDKRVILEPDNGYEGLNKIEIDNNIYIGKIEKDAKLNTVYIIFKINNENISILIEKAKSKIQNGKGQFEGKIRDKDRRYKEKNIQFTIIDEASKY